jgi:cell division protein FtsA|tara:strand:+ start:2729 stop:3931 length:1203 start_codon:yes stop_codon:yes gene_type:complete
MFNFLKNQRKIIIFDIGSQKIAAISFKIINNKPIIFDMEYQKNNLDESKPHFLSNNIKKIFQKISKKNEKYTIYCNITDPRVVSKKNKTQIKAGKLGISKKDVRKIFKKCVFESKISGKNLLHSYPLNFIIDNKNITDEPLNKYCENLGINCFNLFVDKNVVKNLNLNFEKNKLHVKSYFDSGIASSLAFLSDQEKKDGVLNIDIGARTSKIVAYINKKIVFVKNLQIAGDDVTSDLSQGLQITHDSSERVKIIHGTLNPPFNEKIEIDLDSKKKKIISMNLLYGIIRPRYDEILEIIRDNVFDEINTRVGIKSVVLTGGASKIYGLKVLCENILNRKTRIGQIENSSSYFYCKPEFSTLLGMINLIKNQEYFDIFKSKNDNKLSIFIERLDKWIEESYV